MAERIERMIVVSGEATVRRVPDLAVVSLSVMVQDRETTPARDKANQRATAIVARLHVLGVPEADVQAPSLTVQPTYDYGRGGASRGAASPPVAPRKPPVDARWRSPRR